MQPGWRSIKEQIEDVNKFFDSNKILLFASIILTYFLGKIQFAESNFFGKLGIGAAYWLVVLLFAVMLYQMFNRINDVTDHSEELNFKTFWHDIKRINFVMLFLFILLLILLASFCLEFIVRYAQPIGQVLAFIIGPILASIIQIIIMLIPVTIAKFILSKADKESNSKDKFVWHLISFLLMGVAIPLIAFLWNRDWKNIFVLPVFVFTITGWIILIDYPIQLIKRNRKSKIEKGGR